MEQTECALMYTAESTGFWLIEKRLTLGAQLDWGVGEEHQLALQPNYSRHQHQFSPVWQYRHVKRDNTGEFLSPRH
jgi:hypothetical protein